MKLLGTIQHRLALAYFRDPTATAYGFRSWDDFFARRWRQGMRPAASPDDACVICNACESSPYRLSRLVRWRDEFALKRQPYSLRDMLRSQ
jgi:phosphatidylserine decarboxylase